MDKKLLLLAPVAIIIAISGCISAEVYGGYVEASGDPYIDTDGCLNLPFKSTTWVADARSFNLKSWSASFRSLTWNPLYQKVVQTGLYDMTTVVDGKIQGSFTCYTFCGEPQPAGNFELFEQSFSKKGESPATPDIAISIPDAVCPEPVNCNSYNGIDVRGDVVLCDFHINECIEPATKPCVGALWDDEPICDWDTSGCETQPPEDNNPFSILLKGFIELITNFINWLISMIGGISI